MTERTWPAGALERLRVEREVRIRTSDADGDEHIAIIWAVVDDRDRVLVRSWKGAGARWFREATAGRPVALLVGDDVHDVIVHDATDADRVAACSAELERKYAGDPATASMVRDEILDTTLELTPA
jgi:hypothetical protein